MKTLILFSTLLLGASAGASCVDQYRAAYVKASLYAQASEAAELYLVKFDFDQGLAEAYSGAAPLFQAMGVTTVGDKEIVLKALSRQMDAGALCPRGNPSGVLATAALLRASLDPSPWVQIAKGEPGKDKEWATCTVKPNIVLVEYSSGRSESYDVALDREAMENLVAQAIASDWGPRALHVRATIPPMIIRAGSGAAFTNEVIYRDSSDIQSREGVSVEKLIEIVRGNCPLG